MCDIKQAEYIGRLGNVDFRKISIHSFSIGLNCEYIGGLYFFENDLNTIINIAHKVEKNLRICPTYYDNRLC